jgi:pilus assembly protein Flp/PilA
VGVIYVLGVQAVAATRETPQPRAAGEHTVCGDAVMTKLANRVVEFLKKEDGPTAVEYAVMLALIIVVCIAAITALGTNASQTFSYVGSNTKPVSGGGGS